MMSDESFSVGRRWAESVRRSARAGFSSEGQRPRRAATEFESMRVAGWRSSPILNYCESEVIVLRDSALRGPQPYDSVPSRLNALESAFDGAMSVDRVMDENKTPVTNKAADQFKLGPDMLGGV